jgi:hypothetical protein
MERNLEQVRFEPDSCDFLEGLDTWGVKEIKALAHAIEFYDDRDNHETLSALINLLNEKVAEIDQTLQRLIHEMLHHLVLK